MKRLVKYIFKKINLLSNYGILKTNKVEYELMPYINGKLFIQNNGRLIIGQRVKFNSSITSNYVGLNKSCTIKVCKNAKLIIGDSSGFSGVSIFCSEKIEIGKYVNFGGNVFIWDTDFHSLDYKMRRDGIGGVKSSPITIEDDVFIGANSIILKGIKIGEKSIVGAGSVVTKDIPANEIWAGNPAKFIRKNI